MEGGVIFAITLDSFFNLIWMHFLSFISLGERNIESYFGREMFLNAQKKKKVYNIRKENNIKSYKHMSHDIMNQ